MFHSVKKHVVLALALALPLAACDDPTGFEPSTRILLSGDEDVAATVMASVAPTFYQAAAVDVSLVEEISVAITGVDVLPADAGENDGGGWISLSVTAPDDLDLTALSSEGIEIAEGDLVQGTYRGVRIFFDNATIRFSEDITIGAATKVGGQDHELMIPSATHTGVKVQGASFTVGESGPVTLEFDDAGSLQAVTLADGTIIMSPVLTQMTP